MQVKIHAFKKMAVIKLLFIHNMLITGIRWVWRTRAEGHLKYLSLSESRFDLVLFIMIMESKDQDKDLEKNIWNPHLKRVTLRELSELMFLLSS